MLIVTGYERKNVRSFAAVFWGDYFIKINDFSEAPNVKPYRKIHF